MIQQKEPVLEISDLSVRFRMYDRGFEQTDLKVVSGLSLTAYRDVYKRQAFPRPSACRPAPSASGSGSIT